ncbi:uncharacterized protein LOC135122492 [Zophobas morio]|uniref:uncharacterized protein LOC135122492 n=1 Tax=Zophobas morio TaxID=2755281 RepID=UPI0030838634
MASVSGRASMGLLKRGWNEIPDIIGSGIMGLIGIAMATGSVFYYYNAIDGDNRRYKEKYTVIRHDDPRAEKVRTDYLGDQ